MVLADIEASVPVQGDLVYGTDGTIYSRCMAEFP
jgi:hypothetical protein